MQVHAVEELILRNRSYRRFSQQRRPSEEELRRMVGAARVSGSAANLQRLRFRLFWEREDTERVFPCLQWAGYLQNWVPAPQERPTAYIVIVTQKEPDATLGVDMGIAAQSILLMAVSMGYGGCVLRSFDREKIGECVARRDWFPQMVIALGTPKEKVVIEDESNGNIRYYRLPDGTHVVPKRTIEELIL